MKYLYINSDLTVEQYDTLPGTDELIAIEEGDLICIRFEKGSFEVAEASIEENDGEERMILDQWTPV